jgi:hypothetical protein
LLSFLYDFKCPDAQNILQKEGGARMFFVPDTPWLIVLPINHILGRVPRMKAFLCGSSSPTILRALSHLKQTHFRHGHADRNGREGTGSPLLTGMLNVHMWPFGRPQVRTRLRSQGHYPCNNAEPTRNSRKRLPIRNAHNVSLSTQEKASRRRAMRAASQ